MSNLQQAPVSQKCSLQQDKSTKCKVDDYNLHQIQNEYTQLHKINAKLKKKGILSMKTQWDAHLQNILLWNIAKWQTLTPESKQIIQQFTIINMYHLSHMAYINAKNNDDQIRGNAKKCRKNIYEFIYPRISQIIDLLREKMGIYTFQELVQMEVNGIQTEKQRQAFRETDQHGQANKKIGHFREAIKKTDQYGQPKKKNIRQPTIQQRGLFLEKTKKSLKIESHDKSDNLLSLFILQKQRQMTNDKDLMLDQEGNKKYLYEIISCEPSFFTQNCRWSDTFNLITSYFQSITNNPIPKSRLIRQNLFKDVEEQRLPNNRCLGCSKFFYYNINIYDESAIKTLLKIFPSIRRLKDIQLQLRDMICGMLNNEGGVILFDCSKEYKSILPHGDKMSQKQKEQFQNRIQSYLKLIYPKVQFGNQATISFVPIVRFGQGEEDQEGMKYVGEEAFLKENYTYKGFKYIDGLFLTRITVRPADPSKLYFWQAQSNHKQRDNRPFLHHTHHNGEVTPLRMRDIGKLIKKKMKKFYIPENVDEQQRRLLYTPVSFLDHQCEKPQQGMVTNACGNLGSDRRQRQYPSQGEGEVFNEMSLIITKRKNYKKIQQKLRDRGFICEIRPCFQVYKYKILETTGIIYHKDKFEALQDQIRNNHYEYDRSRLKFIQITSFLKIQDYHLKKPMKSHDFQRYYCLFTEEFERQGLRLYELVYEDEIEYYFQTDSKLSLIFLYIQLKNSNQKVLFKDLPNLQQKTQKEKGQRKAKGKQQDYPILRIKYHKKANEL